MNDWCFCPIGLRLSFTILCKQGKLLASPKPIPTRAYKNEQCVTTVSRVLRSMNGLLVFTAITSPSVKDPPVGTVARSHNVHTSTPTNSTLAPPQRSAAHPLGTCAENTHYHYYVTILMAGVDVRIDYLHTNITIVKC
jgi:hypothetical protein